MSAPRQATHSDTSAHSVASAHGAGTASWAVGLSLFAGMMMIITGLFNTMEGVVALARNEVYAVTPRYIFAWDLTTWGWIHIIVGVLLTVAAVGLFAGTTWARVIAIVIASLSIVANFAWLPHYPVWAILVIALDVVVIWAVATWDAGRA